MSDVWDTLTTVAKVDRRRDHGERTCPGCKTVFYPKGTRERRKVYCSSSCHNVSKSLGERNRSGATKTCGACGELFAWKMSRDKFCSSDLCQQVKMKVRNVGSKYPRDIYRLLRDSVGLCDCCGEVIEDRAQVDHCHETEKIRGLLHMKCNIGIGMGDEDPEKLFRWQVYLARHQFDLRDLLVVS